MLDVEVRAAGPDRIRVTAFSEIESPSFSRPHGIAWIDDDTVIVANRTGILSVIALPAGGRNDAAAMQHLIPGWTFDPKRPALVR